jgi:hypothetical protein
VMEKISNQVARKEEEGIRKWRQVICLRWCCQPLWSVVRQARLMDSPLHNGPKTVDLSLSVPSAFAQWP